MRVMKIKRVIALATLLAAAGLTGVGYTNDSPVRTENFVTLYFQKFRAISLNPYLSQMALSVNG